MRVVTILYSDDTRCNGAGSLPNEVYATDVLNGGTDPIAIMACHTDDADSLVRWSWRRLLVHTADNNSLSGVTRCLRPIYKFVEGLGSCHTKICRSRRSQTRSDG